MWTLEPMDTTEGAGVARRARARSTRARTRRWLRFTGGGPDGHEELTATTGVILFILLAVLGVTILRVRQLISIHLFLGLLLLALGPIDRGMWVGIHKVSFIAWIVFTALHVLGHLPAMPASLRAATNTSEELGGVSASRTGRWIALIGPPIAGLVLAIVLVPDFASWSHSAAFLRHHDH